MKELKQKIQDKINYYTDTLIRLKHEYSTADKLNFDYQKRAIGNDIEVTRLFINDLKELLKQ